MYPLPSASSSSVGPWGIHQETGALGVEALGSRTARCPGVTHPGAGSPDSSIKAGSETSGEGCWVSCKAKQPVATLGVTCGSGGGSGPLGDDAQAAEARATRTRRERMKPPGWAGIEETYELAGRRTSERFPVQYPPDRNVSRPA